MNDHLIDPPHQIHFARGVGLILVGEAVFVVDVVAAQIVGDQVERLGEFVAPEVERDSARATAHQAFAGHGQP